MEERYIDHLSLRKIGYQIFLGTGIQSVFYKQVIDNLVETSLRGVDSHGIRLIPHYVRALQIGRINKKPKFSFRKTSVTTAIFNADHGFGINAGIQAMSLAIDLAKEGGMGSVAVKNSTHFGAAAIYSLMAAKKNMIGLSFTNTDSLVLPFGAKYPYLGTNPICFAAPVAEESPFCLDMATSKIAWNKVLAHRRTNTPLDTYNVVDKEGNSCTDPHLASALLPLGEYKGYGLALMIEILCSMLTGMPYGKHIKKMYPLTKEKRQISHFFLAIDIKKFQKIHDFKFSLKNMLEEIRSIPVAEEFKNVLVPGDPEKLSYSQRLKEGIPITEEVYEGVLSILEELNIHNEIFLKHIKQK